MGSETKSSAYVEMLMQIFRSGNDYMQRAAYELDSQPPDVALAHAAELHRLQLQRNHDMGTGIKIDTPALALH